MRFRHIEIYIYVEPYDYIVIITNFIVETKTNVGVETRITNEASAKIPLVTKKKYPFEHVGI